MDGLAKIGCEGGIQLYQYFFLYFEHDDFST